MDDLIAKIRAAIDVQFDTLEWPHRPACQILKPVPPGFPFPTFTCNCGAPTLWMNFLEAHRDLLEDIKRELGDDQTNETELWRLRTLAKAHGIDT